jgi:lipooligosaccharide transport system ATP-binding protein
MSVVIASQLTKQYGDLKAVQGISFEVNAGECYGLLGPNGAGKTTTMSMVRCVSPPTGGQLKVFGRDVARFGRVIRHRLGVVPQNDNLDPDLTVHDNLVVYASYFGIRRKEADKRAEELLSFVSLEKKARVRIHELSGGMRRRLLVARALINNPDLLILDEPTTGLDPQARHHIWQRLRTLKSQGIPMMLCTHYMDEAENLCDRLSIIDGGTIIETGTPQSLIERNAGQEVLELLELARLRPEALERILQRSVPQGVRMERFQDSLIYFTPPGNNFPPAFLDEMHKERIPLTVRRASLEDVFLNLTGRELRE